MSSNPYQPPAKPLGVPAPAPVTRPTSAVVFGILNIIFGALGLCGTVFTAAMFLVPQQGGQNPVLDIMAENTTYRIFMQVSIILGLIATLVVIASGIGLLQLKPYGRTLAIVYGVYAVVAGIVGIIVNFVFIIGPLMQKASDAPAGPEQAAAIGGAIGGSFGGCIGLIYPVVLLFFMYRPNVVEAFRAG
jgi:hypothetical protein